jgi:hypothetical protein
MGSSVRVSGWEICSGPREGFLVVKIIILAEGPKSATSMREFRISTDAVALPYRTGLQSRAHVISTIHISE